MSSVVCAGENVLHSMAMPAIPMRGKSSDGACLQAKEKVATTVRERSEKFFSWLLIYNTYKSTKEWVKTCTFAP